MADDVLMEKCFDQLGREQQHDLLKILEDHPPWGKINPGLQSAAY